MEIKIKKTVEETVEISFPYYVVTACHAYKIISETSTILVTHGLSVSPAIQANGYINNDFFNEPASTEAEFLIKFNEVLEKLVMLNHAPPVEQLRASWTDGLTDAEITAIDPDYFLPF